MKAIAYPRSVGISAAALTLVLMCVITPSPANAGAPGITCTSANVPVTIALLPETMHGTFCLPAGATPATVQVLVPGSTYNESYWDFPYDPSVYSFRLAMNTAGYATFTLDRLGTGHSSKPLSVLVTATAQASAVHQVIQALRAGHVGGVSFPKVLLGGHSLGSAICVLEAATYHDVNAVLLTGFSHQINPVPLAEVFASFYPADLDPAFTSDFYDPGYLTTEPGTRAADFYYPATTDPAVVAADEATKDVLSTTEAPDGIGVAVLLPYTTGIQAPVLIADGDHDDLFCLPTTGNCASAATLAADEAPYFSAAACLQTYLLAGSGHDVNLATDTQLYQAEVVSWANEFVGAGSGTVTPPPGACS